MNNLKDLILLGASGLGREVVWIAERMNAVQPTWNILGFIDANPETHGTKVCGYPVLGGDDVIARYPDAYYVCSVGSARIRRKIIAGLEKVIAHPNYAVLLDPSVIMSESVRIGPGCMISPGNVFTKEIEIGSHVFINVNCFIGHNAVVSDFVTINPGANISGNVELSECVEIGIGAQVIQGKKIGPETIVGAGSTVVKDLPEKCTAVGIPAKPIKFHE